MLSGLFVLNNFSEDNSRFDKQVIFVLISLFIYILFSNLDVRFLKRSRIVFIIYAASLSLLSLLFVLGHVSKGAQSWFKLGGLSFQPADLTTFAVLLILSKYFTKRHAMIADFTHIFISGLYAAVPAFLILIQPDFGNALIIFALWLGMVLVSGMSIKHISVVFSLGVCAFLLMWQFTLAPYQKARIGTFLNPMSDIRGTGYNVNQAVIAFGSGETFGKGIGFGTQSRLKFLPEYQTDFIIAAFAEEWGFVGICFMFFFMALLIGRLLFLANLGATNFERLFIMGAVILFMIHFIINIGMNMGIMPVTGITLPFLSYGGSHLIIEAAILGVITSMSRYGRTMHPELLNNEFVGLER